MSRQNDWAVNPTQAPVDDCVTVEVAGALLAGLHQVLGHGLGPWDVNAPGGVIVGIKAIFLVGYVPCERAHKEHHWEVGLRLE